MKKSNVRDKKFTLISLILILIGTAVTVILVFYFIDLFRNPADSSGIRINNAEQLGATDTSVLIGWTGSDAAARFRIICSDTDGKKLSESRTEEPFAAVHGLEPNSSYTISIFPENEKSKLESPYELTCSTSSKCSVTGIKVGEITYSSAEITWKYEGADEGFTVIAYALDSSGKRHLTTEKITLSKDSEKKCTLKNLLSDLTYTVCVMPNTKYAEVSKSTFTTPNYFAKYKSINVIQFVTCTYDSEDTPRVHVVDALERKKPYKTSLLFNGEAKADETVNYTVYVTDENSNLISADTLPDVSLNPKNQEYYFYRTVMTEFTAPKKKGRYFIHSAIDNVTVSRAAFSIY